MSEATLKRPRLADKPSKTRPKIALFENAKSALEKEITARAEHGKVKKVETSGDRVIRFCQTLKVPDGKDVGKSIVLRDHQINIFKAIYDPMRPGTNLRQVVEAVISMGRKNAKTTDAAMLLLCHMVGPEALRNSQCYSAAYEREQAALIWRSAKNMVTQDEELAYYLSFQESYKIIKCPFLGTYYKALSAESRSKHGLNPAFVFIDELAQFGADARLYNTLKTSQGAYDQPLMIIGSTQAADDTAVLSSLIDYGMQTQDGTLPPDPSFKVFLYTVPDKDDNDKPIDIFDEEVWKLANPALGDFRSLPEMRDMARRAKESPIFEMTFRNLYLNQRVSGVVGFVSKTAWAACGGTVDAEALKGKICYGGLDLSKKKDLTAYVLYFPIQEGIKKSCLLCWFWTPADLVEDHEKEDKAPYSLWIDKGYIEAVAGKKINYGSVVETLINSSTDYTVKAIGFDRWRIEDLEESIERDHPESDLVLVPFSQTMKETDPAIDDFEDLILHENLNHGNNPVLTWNAAGTRVVKNHTDLKRFDKARSNCRIDGMVAAMMAIRIGTQLTGKDDADSGYNVHGLIAADVA